MAELEFVEISLRLIMDLTVYRLFGHNSHNKKFSWGYISLSNLLSLKHSIQQGASCFCVGGLDLTREKAQQAESC